MPDFLGDLFPRRWGDDRDDRNSAPSDGYRGVVPRLLAGKPRAMPRAGLRILRGEIDQVVLQHVVPGALYQSGEGKHYICEGRRLGKHPDTGAWLEGVGYRPALGAGDSPYWTTLERWVTRFEQVTNDPPPRT